MQAPANAVPKNSSEIEEKPRSAVPSASRRMTPSRTRSVPTRCASLGASGENSPMQMTGKVVRILVPKAERPRPVRISGKSADALEKTGRRLKAMSTRLAPSKNLPIGDLPPCGSGAGTSSASASINSTEARFCEDMVMT